MRTDMHPKRTPRLPRRLLTAVGAAAVIPLTIAPLAPALANDEPGLGLGFTETVAEAPAADAATQESAPTQDAAMQEPAPTQDAAPSLAAVSPETELPPAETAAEMAEETAAEAPPETVSATAAGPSVTANRSTPPASGWYQTRQPVRFVAEDAGAGVRSITVVVDDTATERAGDDTTLYIEGNGNHTVEYWATDNDGRNGEAKILMMAIDGLAPRIATAAPRTIAQGDRVPLGLDCWDEHSGVQSCYSSGTDDDVLPSEELGEHSVTLHSRDYAGNETNGTFTYLVEERVATTPELRFNIAPEPASGWYRGPVGVIVSASTPDAADRITGVHWWSNGPVSSNGDAVDEEGIAFTIDADGVTEVTYTATTARGGYARGETTVRIDGVQPEIRFAAPAGTGGAVPKVELGSASRVGFDCSDAHSGVDFCGEELPLLTVSDAPGQDAFGSAARAAQSIALDTGSLGNKSVTVESADVAGNRTKATFEYEVVAPRSGGDTDGGSGGSGGDGSGQPPTKPAATPATPSNRTERLANTGFSWAPLGAIGVAAVAAGAVISLMRFREKDQ